VAAAAGEAGAFVVAGAAPGGLAGTTSSGGLTKGTGDAGMPAMSFSRMYSSISRQPVKIAALDARGLDA
jgi:hypothetical protein